MRSGYVRGIYRPYLATTQENVGVRGRGARAPSANRALLEFLGGNSVLDPIPNN